MAVTVLGELLVDGEPLSPRERAVLAALVMRAGRTVSPDEIADAYWGERPPSTWPKQVQAAIARLRRRLGPAAIVTGPGGYRLTADPETIDAGRFERLLEAGRLHLTAGDPERAVAALESALALWRGRPYADLASWPDALAECGRLDELRALAEEDLLQARLDRGEHGSIVGTAEKLVRGHPLRERRWVLLATALYRAGRQADALAALRAARRRFDEELGVEPGQELDALETAILRHDPALDADRASAPPDVECPYRGLAAYESEDADQFFGRQAEVAAALDRLSGSRFLALAGPSGCGKSSLVRAGVVPSLRRRGLAVTVVTPASAAGAELRKATSAPTGTDVLVVDQFEEVFHLGLADSEVADLCSSVAGHPGIVILTVRSDFLDECAAQPALAPLLAEGVRLVTPMTSEQLREAIVEPSRRAGLRLEHGLVEIILRDAAGAPGVLPHVSHALVETWLRREGPVLTINGYEASGGISGAIAQSADRLYQSLDTPQRDLCRSTLLRLVALSPDGIPVRQRLRLKPLRADSARDRLLSRLAGARLVSTEGDSVMVTHEAVALAWPRLRGWLEDSADDVRRMGALSAAAERWEADGEPVEDLYRGARLQAALEMRDSGVLDLTPLEGRFLDESARQEEASMAELAARARREATLNRRLRGYLTAAVTLLVLSIIATGLLVTTTREANRQRAAADAARESATVEAVVARSLALRDTERDVAALLAAEAYRRWPDDPRSRAALLGTLTAAGGFLGSRYLDLDIARPGARVPGTDLHLVAGAEDRALLVDARGHPVAKARLDWSSAESADAEQLVAVSADGSTGVIARGVDVGDRVNAELVVLDLADLRQRSPAIPVDVELGSLTVAPDGSQAALGAGQDAVLGVLDLASGRVRQRRLVPDADASGWTAATLVSWTADERIVVGGAYSRIHVFDPASLRRVDAIAVPAGSSNVALTTTGNVVVASGSRRLVAADLVRSRFLWSRGFSVHHPAPCPWLAASTEAAAVFCGDWFGNLEQRDLRNGLPVASLDPQLGSVGPLSVSTDGAELTALGAGAPAISRWRLDGSGLAHRLVARGSLIYEGYDLDGRVFVTARRPAGAREYDDVTRFAVWDPDRDTAVLTLPGDAEGVGWAGRDVLSGYSVEAGGVAFLDLDERTWYRQAPSLDYSIRGWPSPRGNRMYSSSEDGTVAFVDPATGRRTGKTIWVGGYINSLSESPDRRRIATAAWDDGWRVQVHDLATGELVADELRGPQLVSYSPDGELYAARDGRLTRHDPDDLSLRGTLAGAHGEVNSMQFSRDGAVLLVTANDETTSLYDVASGLRLGDPVRTAAPLIVPAFLRPDGQAMAVTVEEGVAIWDLDPAHQFAAACRLAGRELTDEEWSTYLGPTIDRVATCSSVLG